MTGPARVAVAALAPGDLFRVAPWDAVAHTVVDVRASALPGYVRVHAHSDAFRAHWLRLRARRKVDLLRPAPLPVVNDSPAPGSGVAMDLLAESRRAAVIAEDLHRAKVAAGRAERARDRELVDRWGGAREYLRVGAAHPANDSPEWDAHVAEAHEVVKASIRLLDDAYIDSGGPLFGSPPLSTKAVENARAVIRLDADFRAARSRAAAARVATRRAEAERRAVLRDRRRSRTRKARP